MSDQQERIHLRSDKDKFRIYVINQSSRQELNDIEQLVVNTEALKARGVQLGGQTVSKTTACWNISISFKPSANTISSAQKLLDNIQILQVYEGRSSYFALSDAPNVKPDYTFRDFFPAHFNANTLHLRAKEMIDKTGSVVQLQK